MHLDVSSVQEVNAFLIELVYAMSQHLVHMCQEVSQGQKVNKL